MLGYTMLYVMVCCVQGAWEFGSSWTISVTFCLKLQKQLIFSELVIGLGSLDLHAAIGIFRFFLSCKIVFWLSVPMSGIVIKCAHKEPQFKCLQ